MNELFEKEPLCFESPEQNVWKYIFHFKGAIAEAVLYRYNSFEDRTVLCVSVSSGCSIGCKFCLPPTEMVNTISGEKQINLIKINDKILSFDEKELKNTINTVTEIFENIYNGELIVFELENGRIIKTTPNHPIYLKNGLIKQASEISETDELKDFY